MNPLLPFFESARPFAPPADDGAPDQTLAEMLTEHEEMALQFRSEPREATDHVDFFSGMIQQHEQAADVLRAQLENHRAG